MSTVVASWPEAMPKFTVVYPAKGKARYRLLEDYRIKGFLIPAGFEFDGASVPRWAWTVSGLTPAGRMLVAALLHDWLYSKDGRMKEGLVSRKEADQLFKQVMLASGASKRRAWLAHQAVRAAGRKYWEG